MHYRLTAADTERIDEITRERQEDKRAKGIHNKYHGKYDQSKTEKIGLMGEIAFAHLSGLPLDTALRDSGDQGIDFTAGFGTIDVKTTTTGYVIFDIASDVKADIIVAAQTGIMSQVVQLPGFCTRRDFLAKHSIKDFGYGDRLVLEHNRLTDIKDLIYWCKQMPTQP